MVAPDAGESGRSVPGGSVGIVLTVGGPTGISVAGGELGIAPAPVAGCAAEVA